MSRSNTPVLPENATRIYRVSGGGAADLTTDSSDRREHLVGYVDADGTIYRFRWGDGHPVGRAIEDRHILRFTEHGARDLGQSDETGAIISVGLLEGGPVGWMEPDGVVLQGGALIGETEVGRVEGPRALDAAAALLLIFLPDEAEADRRAARQR